MVNHAKLRTVALGLALSVCALLLGLSEGHSALPGDTFQVARAAHAVASPAVEVAQHRKPFPPRDGAGDGDRWLAVVPALFVLEAQAARTAAVPAGDPVAGGRACGASGCRGPPNR